jgi:hypothetical protein
VRLLLLIARRFFLQIFRKILVVLLGHLALALEVDLFSGERRVGRMFRVALDVELHFRKIGVS